MARKCGKIGQKMVHYQEIRPMPKKIEISHRTIVFTFLFLLFLWFIYIIRDIILQLFIALLIMAILNPLVSKLSKRKIPRGISVFVAYLLFFGLIGVTIAAIVPPLISQTTTFINNLPDYMVSLGATQTVNEKILEQIIVQLGSIPAEIVKVIGSIFSNILNVVAVMIFAFYFLLVREKLDEHLGFFFGDEKRHDVGKIIDLLEKRLGGWARAELLLMALVGVSTYVGLTLLGVPFSLPLAILAGLLEIVPYLGPIIAAVPAILIGLTVSPLMALAVAGLAFLIQQVENYVFIPKVMQKSAGVSPIITLIALAIGFRLAGIVGVVISVPVVITLQVVGREYLLKD